MNHPTPIADMITEMLKNCIPMEMIITAVRSMERAMSTLCRVDETAEKRRTWDREYRRRKRLHPPDTPDIHPTTPDVGVIALSSLEKKDSYPEVVSKKEKKERGSKLPPDWKPDQTHYEEGEKLGLSRAAVDERAERMRSWCTANANRAITTKADWNAAFMGAWLKDSRNGHGTSGNRTTPTAGPPQTGADAILAGMGRLASRVAQRQLAERQGGLDLASGDDADAGTVRDDAAAHRRAV